VTCIGWAIGLLYNLRRSTIKAEALHQAGRSIAQAKADVEQRLERLQHIHHGSGKALAAMAEAGPGNKSGPDGKASENSMKPDPSHAMDEDKEGGMAAGQEDVAASKIASTPDPKQMKGKMRPSGAASGSEDDAFDNDEEDESRDEFGSVPIVLNPASSALYGQLLKQKRAIALQERNHKRAWLTLALGVSKDLCDLTSAIPGSFDVEVFPAWADVCLGLISATCAIGRVGVKRAVAADKQ